MMASDRQLSRKNNVNRNLLRELPYYGVNILVVHGQFNNSASISHTPNVYIEKLHSIYDLDLFSLNTGLATSINPDSNILNQHFRSLYYSPNSFYNLKRSLLSSHCTSGSFSIFHNNIRSLKRNLENLQTQLLNELDFQFSITALSETRITNVKEIDFNPKISGYVFEYVPTLLSAGGVGIYINENLDYTVIERTSNPVFQALWIEIIVPNKKNIICGVLYRQHNSPERFLSYFNDTVERVNAYDKPVYIAGDFNIDLLKSESCNYVTLNGSTISTSSR